MLATPVTRIPSPGPTVDPRQRFAHLLPLSRPGPGEQYAFEVDLDACTGCKACVAACHSLNGLDADESWRTAGAATGRGDAAWTQTVTSACHHCADPACANGCPVLAYEKDPDTGIVRHLDDQCIGCSYCLLKCPYDVPKYSVSRGIVRKCDMCQGRLAAGEAPACVQACPHEAIRIRLVHPDELPAVGAMVPGAFDSGYTRPTTVYRATRPMPPAGAADEARLRKDPGHEPLVWMLVLTQAAAGGFAAAAAGWACGAIDRQATGLTTLTALALLMTGLTASVLHLGQPLKAWRAFMGWRKSWLSREIMAFGAFTATGAAACFANSGPWLMPALAMATALGAIAVFTSVMVYADTQRPFWAAGMTARGFGGTSVMLGAALAGAVWSWHGTGVATAAIGAATALRWATWLADERAIRQALRDAASPWHRPARILTELHARERRTERRLLLPSGVVLPALACFGPLPGAAALLFLTMLAGEVLSRRNFFTAADGPRMPGN